MYLTRQKVNNRYSNAIDLCFWDKACIKRREEAQAAANQQLAEQQMLLQQVLNTKSSGLSTGAIVAIVATLLGVTALAIFLIKKRKI